MHLHVTGRGEQLALPTTFPDTKSNQTCPKNWCNRYPYSAQMALSTFLANALS